MNQYGFWVDAALVVGGSAIDGTTGRALFWTGLVGVVVMVAVNIVCRPALDRMDAQRKLDAIRPHLEGDEQLLETAVAQPYYVGITDRRFILVMSSTVNGDPRGLVVAVPRGDVQVVARRPRRLRVRIAGHGVVQLRFVGASAQDEPAITSLLGGGATEAPAARS
ncbi:MAG: hypothetical protein JWM98_450 [Thermoleophilia bacterium]|nr:hypothetical protein [Thermoleophilia bacterium]